MVRVVWVAREVGVLEYVEFGVICLLAAAVLTCVALGCGLRSMLMERRCTSRCAGRVVGFSSFPTAHDLRLPIVEYRVGGHTYRARGPVFRNYINQVVVSVRGGTPHEKTNIVARESLPQTYRRVVHTRKASIVTVEPLRRLFPIGSRAEVFYDPGHPSLAYVQRYARRDNLFFGPLLAAAACALVGVAVLLFWL